MSTSSVFEPIETLNQPGLLDIKTAAETRRSIRKYKPEPISTEDLTELIRLTSLAPSSRNIQPWRFLIVRSPELKAELQAAAYNQSQVTSAPAVIVLYSDMR